jgi:hypothetical protein
MYEKKVIFQQPGKVDILFCHWPGFAEISTLAD